MDRMNRDPLRPAHSPSTRGRSARIEPPMTFTREYVAQWIQDHRATQGLPATVDSPGAQRRVLAAVDRVYAAQAREAEVAAKAAIGAHTAA